MSLRQMLQAREAAESQQNRSEDLKLIEQQAQTIADLREQMRRLSSENSLLKNELQKKSERIVQLNEADLIVSKNEDLTKENQDLREQATREQEARENAERAAHAVKFEYEQKERNLAKAQTAVEQERESIAERIEQEASEKVRRKVRSLDILDGVSVGLLCLYPIFLTILTGFKEEAFRSDFGAFWKAIWKGIVFMAGLIDRAGDAAAGLGDLIVAPWLAAIVHWLLWGIVVLVLAVALLVALGWLFWKLGCLYAGGSIGIYSLLDGWTLVEILASLSVIVWFAAPIRAAIPVNLVLLFLIAHAAYVGVRLLIWTFKPY